MVEWMLVYKVNWYGWVFGTLYSCAVEVFMSIIGFGVVATGISNLLGIAPKEILVPLAWYKILLITGVGGVLAWVALRGIWASLIDMIRPAIIFQGPLEHISVEVRQTKNSGYRVFALTAGTKNWDIPCHSVSYKPHFERDVTVGNQMRLTYRAGTELVTDLWVETGDGRVSESTDKSDS